MSVPVSSAPEKTPSTPVEEAAPVPASTPAPPRINPAIMARLAARSRIRADQNGVLLAGAIMAGVGWVLLYRLVVGSPPLAFPRWLFFILLYMAVTGTVLPLVWYLNQRFSQPVPGGVILRQSMWFGLFAVTASWLQMTRALSGAVAFFLALSFFVIEFFLRMRERG